MTPEPEQAMPTVGGDSAGVGGDPAPVTLLQHLLALRAADLRLLEERDRRYAEVRAEQEKALKIKEAADARALELARDIQTYKDEQANELREQISRERGLYVTQGDLKAATEKLEAIVKPLAQYVASQQGRSSGLAGGWSVMVGAIVAAAAVVAIVVAFAA